MYFKTVRTFLPSDYTLKRGTHKELSVALRALKRFMLQSSLLYVTNPSMSLEYIDN